MGRARSKNPKRNQHCLRLTDTQEDLLRRYAEFKGFDSEMDAVRAMIDGLEDWFARQESRERAHQSGPSHQPAPEERGRGGYSGPAPRSPHSGLPAERPDTADGDTSVGDFAGRPSVGLPEARPFDDE